MVIMFENLNFEMKKGIYKNYNLNLQTETIEIILVALS